MSVTMVEASVPVFARHLTNVAAWLDTALAGGGDEAALMAARLAPDMLPFSAQVQMACDTAKNAVARLTGQDAPAMADTEASFAELRDRCRRTIAFVEGVAPAAFAGAEERPIVLSFPNGSGYRFIGRDYLLGFALPNFFFHVTTAYALLRAQGVALGKGDYLQHLGGPTAG